MQVDSATGMSIQTLSTALPSEATAQSVFSAYASYWNTTAFADNFARAALQGSGDFAGWDNTSRRELLTKGAAYQNVWQHVVYRLQKGVSACVGGKAGAVLEWEIAWALFAGSLEGVDGSGSGKSVYALGDKRCPQFDTCKAGTSLAGNNEKARELWKTGMAALAAGSCFGAAASQELIVAQITLPLVQGTLREAWESDLNGGNSVSHGPSPRPPARALRRARLSRRLPRAARGACWGPSPFMRAQCVALRASTALAPPRTNEARLCLGVQAWWRWRRAGRSPRPSCRSWRCAAVAARSWCGATCS